MGGKLKDENKQSNHRKLFSFAVGSMCVFKGLEFTKT